MSYRRALAHLGAKEWKKAIAAYTEAVRLDPDNARVRNGFAWLLATCPVAEFRDAIGARTHAEKAVEVSPLNELIWNTCGVARYRAGDWPGAIAALTRAEELMSDRYYAFNAFFLAMAQWQLGNKEEARKWYGTAIEWMQKKMPQNEELLRFRAEAAELLKIDKKAMPK